MRNGQLLNAKFRACARACACARFFLLFFCVTLPLSLKAENALLVSENSLETLQWIEEFISKAESSIEFASYGSGGKVFRKLMQKIQTRLELHPEMQVWVLNTALTMEEEDLRLVDQLLQKWPNNFHITYTMAHFSHMTDYITNECHPKLLIVDEKYFTVGGTNLHEAFCTKGDVASSAQFHGSEALEALPGGTRDMDIAGRGEIASELRGAFHKLNNLWKHYFETCRFEKNLDRFSGEFAHVKTKIFSEKFERSAKIVRNPEIKMILSGPCHEPNLITQEYERLCNDAKEEIVVGNFYFNPVSYLFDALKNAAQRGVRVTLISNGIWERCAYIATLFGWANRVNYVPLFYGRDFSFWEFGMLPSQPLNVEIFEFQVANILYHKKVMVVDKRKTLIGSYNLNAKSDYGDYELVLVIDSPQIASQTLKVLNEDKSLSQKITTEDAIFWYFDPGVSWWGACQKLLQLVL